MKQNKLSFQNIIEAEFGNANIDEIKQKLEEHNLFDFIANCVSQINEHLKVKAETIKQNEALNIAPIGAMMLVKFNDYFRDLLSKNNNSKKVEIEYFLGNFTKRILIIVIDIVPQSIKQKQLQNIVTGLSDACKLHNYDFEKLSAFLRIDEMVLELYSHLSFSETPVLSNTSQLPGFKMKNKSTESLSILIEILNKENITKDNEKIIQLFNTPKKNLAIEFNENKITQVLQFMAVLKNSGLISYHACGGFYQVLSCHVKNFDAVFLNGKTPQQRIDKVRKLKNWCDSKDYFDGQLKQLLTPRHSRLHAG